MKRKLSTENLVCLQERLVIISYTTSLSFALERIGSLAAITIIVFYLLVLSLFALPNTPEKQFASIYSESLIKPLVNTFCFSLGSTLLFIESTTIHPLYLWVIKDHDLHQSFFMLFNYHFGTSKFDVKIFDGTQCQKKYEAEVHFV
jgi:hypothetical protein